MKNSWCPVLFLVSFLLLFPLLASAQDTPLSWYEIFVSSYQDSDGDGIGDLKGVESRLDYIEDMGFDGIWLMPVMPSPSYHKYDVTDYLSVDESYGTTDDLKSLIAACHARGIRVILDMPINHTSTQHPWFLSALQALEEGDMDNPYISYYHFSEKSASRWTGVTLGDRTWYYEEQFQGGGMPDLNLDEERVWDELRDIFHFWLAECDADGFRLDAVTSYDTNHLSHNVEILARVKQLCEEIRPGSFLVGEAWTGLGEIASYYESGVDAFFLFPVSQAEGWICRALRARTPAKSYLDALSQVQTALPDVLWAPFLCNHDTGRTIGLLQARSNPSLAKFAEGILHLFGGSTFTYYGEEIGMVGSGDDPNKRLSMYWNDQDMTLQPPGVTKLEYAYPSVDEQLQDPDSLLHYIRRLNGMKHQYPAYAAQASQILFQDATTFLLEKTSDDGALLIAVNFSPSKEAVLEDVPSDGILFDLETGHETARLDAGQLTLPPHAIVLLHPAP
ncbi:MAG: hypothetical protein IJ083_08890 [Clostridia bacterium]|nr:hypothetical protein [Clostridia bacterium]